jgi:hypothetical protein
MAVEENNITKAKLEINGEWYETKALASDDCGCDQCDLQEQCGLNGVLYKLCEHLGTNVYFKKTGESLKEARFLHG